MDNAMQAILNAAREYGFYVYRGDPPGYDFNLVDFIRDGTWHELDLSEIIPEHAHAADIQILCRNIAVSQYVFFKRHGQVLDINKAAITTQTAVVSMSGDLVVALDKDRKIDYQIQAGVWLFLSIVIKGWWY